MLLVHILNNFKYEINKSNAHFIRITSSRDIICKNLCYTLLTHVLAKSRSSSEYDMSMKGPGLIKLRHILTKLFVLYEIFLRMDFPKDILRYIGIIFLDLTPITY